jgi:hypothetical protein
LASGWKTLVTFLTGTRIFFVKQVLEFLSPGIQCENYNSPPFCSEVKNVWSFSSMTIASITVIYDVVLN